MALRSIGLALLVAVAPASAAADAPAPGPETPSSAAAPLRLSFRGNTVLFDEVYLAVLSLPEDARANEVTAALVRSQLLAFLHKSGFELAHVLVRPNGDALMVDIDEGALEKVVFRGQLTVQTLRLKLALNLPHDVFNRPALERELDALARQLGIERVWFELVPTEEVKHVGPQIEQLPDLPGLALVKPRRAYELHIFTAEREWDTGFGLDLRSGFPDGLELGANYQGQGLLFAADRWRVAASGGGALRERIADERLYPSFSRGFAEIRWYSPPLVARMARPFIWLRAEAIERQRPDLGVEDYFHATADGSLHLQYALARDFDVSLGGGFQWRRLFGFKPSPGVELAPTVFESERMRPFALLRTHVVFGGDEARWDRRHELNAEARQYFGLRDPWYGEGRLAYQVVRSFGWHDLWLRANGVWLWGEVLLHNEEPVAGRHLRAVFGQQYVRRVGSASAEFRFSVTRDLYKISVFHDAAVFGAIDRATGEERLLVGNSFGPGFHALIEGMLQLDLYLAFGFDTQRRFDSGVHASLLKVF